MVVKKFMPILQIYWSLMLIINLGYVWCGGFYGGWKMGEGKGGRDSHCPSFGKEENWVGEHSPC
jgi:hypothetical protein